MKTLKKSKTNRWGRWNCPQCPTERIEKRQDKCPTCHEPRFIEIVDDNENQEELSEPEFFQVERVAWSCRNCGKANSANNDFCLFCNKSKF